MRSSYLLRISWILTSAALIASPTDIHQISLRQALLRESVPYISKLWDVPISLDADLSNIQDLYFDYHPKKAESLDQVLIGIAGFIEKEHHIAIEWSYEKNCIILRKKNKG